MLAGVLKKKWVKRSSQTDTSSTNINHTHCQLTLAILQFQIWGTQKGHFYPPWIGQLQTESSYQAKLKGFMEEKGIGRHEDYGSLQYLLKNGKHRRLTM